MYEKKLFGRGGWIAVLLVAAFALTTTVALADLPSTVWPADKNVMSRPIDSSWGIDPYSDQLIDDLKSGLSADRLSFAVGAWTMSNYIINGSNYQLEDIYVSTGYCPIGQWINDVPFPTDQVVRTTPKKDTDRNTDFTDTVHGIEYSFWRIDSDGDGIWQRNNQGYYECENAGFIWTNSSGGNPMACSLRGPSLSHTVGLVYPEELAAGYIDHGLCSAIPGPSSLTVPPATKTDGDEFGTVEYPDRMPEIAVYRLKPSVWTDTAIESQGWTDIEETVAKAARDYGIWVTDNSGSVHIYANSLYAYADAVPCGTYDPYVNMNGGDCSLRDNAGTAIRLFPVDFIDHANFEVMDTIWEPYPKPDKDLDYDSDGMRNAHETVWAYYNSGFYPAHNDPSNALLDLDNDGLTNGEECELAACYRNQTLNPLDPDTDGDGYTDYEEAYNWSADPTNPCIVPDPAWPGLPTGANLALGKTTSGDWANSQYAVDGDETTIADDGQTSAQLIVDLGSIQTVSRVLVKWHPVGNYYGRGFTVDVSTDGNNWTTIKTWTRGDGGLDDAYGWTGSARYVRLNVTEAGSPWGLYLRELEVYGASSPQPPVANFSGNPTSGTAPLAVMFTDLSSNSPTSWDWTFGDGGSSSAQNPSHSYAVGTYSVSLEATNAQGSDTETKNNYITASSGGSAPVADFVGNPTSGTAPLSVSFTDQSTNSPTSWSWTFGDGGTSTAQNPSHSYAAGDYTVSLQATNSYGSDTETKTNYISASGGGGGDFTPASYTVQTGTYQSGGLSDVQTSDNSYLVVSSIKSGGKQTTEIEYTFNTGLSSLSSLSVTHEWHISITSEERQKTRLWNYSTSGWDEVDNQVLNMSGTDTTVVVNVSNPANYISGGEVRVWLRCGDHTNSAFDQSTDLVKITAAP